MKTFNESYEDLINSLSYQLGFSDKLVSDLQEKRAFGLKKYGEKSYQLSLDSAMKIDTLQHGKEEVIDLVNYLLHEMFKALQKGDLHNIDLYKKMLNDAEDFYNLITSLQG